MADINDLATQASRRAGRQRTSQIRSDTRPRRTDDAPTVLPSHRGARVVCEDGRYRLQGQRLEPGDTIELYTNVANGWLRGRFEPVGDRPHFSLNLWDPQGAKDADGLPPWSGELTSVLPEGAICRWPKRVGEGLE